MNTDDLDDSHRYWLTTDFTSRDNPQIALVDTLESMLHRHMYLPEPKEQKLLRRTLSAAHGDFYSALTFLRENIVASARKRTAITRKATIYRQCGIVRSSTNADSHRVGVPL